MRILPNLLGSASLFVLTCIRRLTLCVLCRASLPSEAISKDHKYYLIGSHTDFSTTVLMKKDEEHPSISLAAVKATFWYRDMFQVLNEVSLRTSRLKFCAIWEHRSRVLIWSYSREATFKFQDRVLFPKHASSI